MASTAGNNGSNFPTHTAPSAPAWPSSSKPPAPHDNSRRRRRCLCVCLLVTLAVLLALAITLLVLFLTVLRVRDPTTRLVSTRLAGVAPRLTFPTISLQLNVTLLLTVAVHNPNPASFSYASGHTDLTYRGSKVGEAEVDPGRIPSKGDGEVRLALTVQADRLAADVAQLLADVESGSVPMESSTRIPGRVTILAVADPPGGLGGLKPPLRCAAPEEERKKEGGLEEEEGGLEEEEGDQPPFHSDLAPPLHLGAVQAPRGGLLRLPLRLRRRRDADA